MAFIARVGATGFPGVGDTVEIRRSDNQQLVFAPRDLNGVIIDNPYTIPNTMFWGFETQDRTKIDIWYVQSGRYILQNAIVKPPYLPEHVGADPAGSASALMNTHESNLPHDDTTNLPFVGFDPAAGAPSFLKGRLYWDDDDKTLAMMTDHENVSLQIGQENFVRVLNLTGQVIQNGSIVYINGSSGNRPTIALATANEEYTNYILGVVTHEIGTVGDERFGYVTTQGIVRGIDTRNYTEGVPLWLSFTHGEMMQERPDAPAHAVFIGIPLNSTVNGSIFVNPSIGNELNELHDVYYPQAPVDGDFLRWNSTFQRWENMAVSPSDINGVEGTVGEFDNKLVRTNGTGGSTVQGSGIEVDDDDNIVGFGAKNYREPIYETGTSGSITISIANGNVQKIALSGGSQLSLANPGVTTCVSLLLLVIPNNHSYVWLVPPTWLTFDGAPPVLATAPGKVNVIPLIWDGSRWLGMTPHSEV